MSDIDKAKELVGQLRNPSSYCELAVLCLEAADLIETLIAELAAEDAEIERLASIAWTYRNEVFSLKANLDLEKNPQ